MNIRVVQLIELTTNVELDGEFGTQFEYAPYVYGYHNSGFLKFQTYVPSAFANIANDKKDNSSIATTKALKFIDFIPNTGGLGTYYLQINWNRGIKTTNVNDLNSANSSDLSYYSNIDLSNTSKSLGYSTTNKFGYSNDTDLLAIQNYYYFNSYDVAGSNASYTNAPNTDSDGTINGGISFNNSSIEVTLHLQVKTIKYEVVNDSLAEPSVDSSNESPRIFVGMPLPTSYVMFNNLRIYAVNDFKTRLNSNGQFDKITSSNYSSDGDKFVEAVNANSNLTTSKKLYIKIDGQSELNSNNVANIEYYNKKVYEVSVGCKIQSEVFDMYHATNTNFNYTSEFKAISFTSADVRFESANYKASNGVENYFVNYTSIMTENGNIYSNDDGFKIKTLNPTSGITKDMIYNVPLVLIHYQKVIQLWQLVLTS